MIQRLLHRTDSPVTLEVFRILIGFVIFYTGLSFYPVLWDFFGLRGLVPFAMSTDSRVNLFLILPQDDVTPLILWLLWITFSFTLIIGLWSRFSAFVLFIVITSFHHRNNPILNSGDTVMRLFCFLMIFAPIGKLISVDRVIRILKGREGTEHPRVPVFGLRLLQLQFSWVYLSTGIYKLLGEEWRSGTALTTVLRIPEFQTLLSHFFTEYNFLTRTITWGSIAIELLLGTLIWVPKLRLPLVIFGILFHIGIDTFMFIPLFEWIMVIGLLLFVDTKYWLRLGEWIRDTKVVKVYFDDDCVFCTRWMRAITILDIRKSLAWEGSPRATAEVILLRPDGKEFGGFFAFREIVWRLPLLWPFVPIFNIPFLSAWAGKRVYRWIADHRYMFMGRVCEK